MNQKLNNLQKIYCFFLHVQQLLPKINKPEDYLKFIQLILNFLFTCPITSMFQLSAVTQINSFNTIS